MKKEELQVLRLLPFYYPSSTYDDIFPLLEETLQNVGIYSQKDNFLKFLTSQLKKPTSKSDPSLQETIQKLIYKLTLKFSESHTEFNKNNALQQEEDLFQYYFEETQKQLLQVYNMRHEHGNYQTEMKAKLNFIEEIIQDNISKLTFQSNAISLQFDIFYFHQMLQEINEDSIVQISSIYKL
ncbi:hypothetical protein PPERSA_12522 [Pseudocohnilembus persalinus]|uniref:Uncharacterized protein n=1 Tax=Pseudocohnilembus persalinus TaxID=266149 RepID=A0A0V0QB81_PSEPJ|nr:hypothetical protein PPERSA_12522 [Pseudocohnilembus persalinus]|eukprot:KRW99418.1 hypothetical protein PPERSA_12522 [Pseudocohnilembus persalinus]